MFSSADVQREFIEDSKKLFQLLFKLGSEDNIGEARNVVDLHTSKYSNIYIMKEEVPIEKKMNDEVKRINKLYAELKNSINYSYINDILPDLQSIKFDSIDTCIEGIKRYQNAIDHNKASNRLHYYNIGKILVHLKVYAKTKKGFKEIVKKYTKYSVEYAYFLMRFYKACEKYHMLKFTTLSIKLIRDNLTDFIRLMEEDLVEWSPPQNISTP